MQGYKLEYVWSLQLQYHLSLSLYVSLGLSLGPSPTQTIAKTSSADSALPATHILKLVSFI